MFAREPFICCLVVDLIGFEYICHQITTAIELRALHETKYTEMCDS